MPYRYQCCKFLQERAGPEYACAHTSVCVYVCSIPCFFIIARWSCLYNKVKRESTKYISGERREKEETK